MRYLALTLCAIFLSFTSFGILPITGSNITCISGTVTLSDATPGGTWSSTNTSVATIGSTSGIYIGITGGTSIISYTVSGVAAVTTVTVTPVLPATTGLTNICMGSTTVLVNTAPAGVWTSSTTGVATIDAGGNVTGISKGTATITYAIGTGCIATSMMSVQLTPVAMTGITTICTGSTSLFSDATPGGAWVSSDVTVATVGTTGLVYGVGPTTAILSYSLPPVSGLSCRALTTVTVDPSPKPISGAMSICDGSTTTLTDTVTGGTWSTSGTCISVGLATGFVTGFATGVTTVTYILPAGCQIIHSFSVNPSPASITGTRVLCVGTTTTLTDASGGGAWSSSNPSIADTTAGTSNIIRGISAGTATITYTSGAGCYATTVVTVNTLAGITGIARMCIGTTATLSDTSPGGTWTSGTTTIATIGFTSGIVSGMGAGTSVITYTSTSGCTTQATVTVNPFPAAIAGASSVCAGTTITLSDATAGGIWASSNSAVASIPVTGGVVTGHTSGTVTITYTIFTTGCTATKTISSGTLSPISGNMTLCAGLTSALSDATTGGTWSSNNTSVTTIGSGTGLATGVGIGTAVITYSVGGSCTAYTTLTVDPAPTAITGPASVCPGSTITLSDAVAGGTWSTGSTSIATVSTGGVVTGVSAGTTGITYTIVTGACAVIKTVTVGLSSPISGTSSLCSGFSTIFSDGTPGGTWSSSNTSITSTNPVTGLVTAILPGIDTITYSISGSCAAYMTFTVFPTPSTIVGPATVCLGTTATFSDARTGGTWSSGSTLIATLGSGTGIVTGITPGTAGISYTMTGGCYATLIITIVPLPSPIVGFTSVCQSNTTLLTDITSGGTWSSSNTSVASIGSSGLCSGINAGTAVISYSLAAGCPATTVFTTNPLPSLISSPTDICIGTTATLSDADAGGIWTSSSTAIARIGSTGIVTALSAGTSVLSYTFPTTGCLTSTNISVDTTPVISASTFSSCSDIDTLIAAGASTYSWAPSSGLSCATCATTTISPPATTAYTVTGTNISGCSVTATVTLNGNRIFGHITFSGPTPDTLDMKVWLIQYNPADSSISALDSTLTCTTDSIGYYEFDGKASGNYMTKAMLLYGNPPGASGYVPTYSLSTPHWDSAATVSHTSGSDSLHITMVYGTVLSGPGFISGYVYSGAGKGTTSDAPVSGMIIYLKNSASQVVSHTYTDVNGHYSFTSLAFDDYSIYPEDYVYKTTPSAAISLNGTTPTINNVDFRQFSGSRIIIPYSYPSGIKTIIDNCGLTVYPNPNDGNFTVMLQSGITAYARIVVTDIIGTKVNEFPFKTNTPFNLHINDAPGLYFISVVNGNNTIVQKMVIR